MSLIYSIPIYTTSLKKIGLQNISKEVYIPINIPLHQTTGTPDLNILNRKTHFQNIPGSVTDNSWKRTRVSDYLPIFSSDHEPLIKYLENQRILGQPDITLTNTLLASFLDKVWVICSATEPHIFIWALLVSAFVVTRLS